MNVLFTLLFGFVCFPFVILCLVVTQLAWSMWIYDADLEHQPVTLHSLLVLVSLGTLAAVLRSECGRRERGSPLNFSQRWFYPGQLRIGMPWWKQILCGCCFGVIASVVDESELLTLLFMSSSTIADLQREHGQRGGVPHVAHAHDTVLLIFVVHSWVWTVAIAGLLGVWSNAAKRSRSVTALDID